MKPICGIKKTSGKVISRANRVKDIYIWFKKHPMGRMLLMMRIKDICLWLKNLYKKGGLKKVYRGVYDYYLYSIANLGYQDYRVDNDFRWSIVERYIDTQSDSLVDIGCAEGFFAIKAAEANLEVYAIEVDQDRIENMLNKCDKNDTLCAKNHYLTPDNVDELPSADIYLFLTVHHHWVWQHGWEEANKMFRVIADRAKIIAYEPPGNKALRDHKQDDFQTSNSVEFYKGIVDEIFDDSVEILQWELVDYTARDRSDPLFILDTSDYHTPPVSVPRKAG